MISLKNLRKTPELFKLKLSLKNDPIDVDIILDLDNKSRQHQTIINELRAKRNSASESIGIAKKAGDDASNAISEMRELGDHLKTVENQLQIVEEKLTTLLYQIPNLPHDSVPQGKNEMDNVEVRYWGEKPSFSFTPKTHLDITDNLSLLDLKRGAKISGSGFPLYTGNGAKLERALINSMLDHHVSQFGFKELAPPVLMRKESMLTTGQLPKFSEDMYHTEIDNLYLAPTAEVPVTNVHRDEVLDESELPVYYVAYTPCFRRESGSYGKDTRGLLRVHQFNKVELVKFTTPETSYDELESLTLQAETILQQLGLHYRVIELCTGDMSFAAAKCYDIEIWAPGENNWLEVSSCSNLNHFKQDEGILDTEKQMIKKLVTFIP